MFGPDRPVTSTTSISAADWPYADLSFTDDQGWEVNTATYGAGQWQVTATDYDTAGNQVRSFTPEGINAVKAVGPVSKDQADWYATESFYNADITDTTGKVVVPAGTLLVRQVSPVRELTLPDGQVLTARVAEATSYDEGAPNGGVNPATGGRYNLPTSTTTTVVGTAEGSAGDVQLTRTTTGYGPVSAGDASGWDLGAATSTTTGGITRVTRYDSAGRVIETRQPSATSSTSPGARRTIYYTAGANSADPTCGATTAAKAWAGLVCRVMAGAPMTQGPDIPDEKTTGYDMYGQPTTVVETSGAATRTTATRYDTAGRQTYSKTTATIPGSTPVPGTFTRYDPATGLVAYVGEANEAGTDATTKRVTTTYDRWGRKVGYTNDTGQTGTTTYDTAGRVASFTDPKGSTTYAYDGTDAAGKTERRGLVTKVSVSRPGTGGSLTFTGAYDATGSLVRQDLPGGITATSQRNILGQETGMTYAGQVTPVTATTDPDTGETTWTPGAPTTAPWVAWSVDRDGLGRVAREFTSTGAAFDPDPAAATPEPGETGTEEVGKAVPYDRAYSYDGAGRLVRVADRVGHGQGAPAGLGPDTPATPAAPCYVRTYAFDGPAGLNGARTGESFAVSTDGDCANPAPAYKATATYAYDAADRPTSGKAVEGAAAPGAYVYDAFGRQTTVPASDAPNRDAGDITIGYFDTDLARTITQGAISTELTLDSQDRRANQTSTDATSVTKTVVRHYTDDSDNPSWVEETRPGQGTTTTRFVEGVSSELGAMIADTGEATVNLSNPHGDNVSSVTVAADQATDVPCTSMGGWSDYTEFGQPYGFTPVNDPAVVGPIGYGWLGAQQRSNTTDTAGLTLMGVRLYNPATGAFTTPDPVYGGNDTAYTYPQDPINSFDLDGKWRKPKWLTWKNAARAATAAAFGVCVFASGGACLAAGVGAAFISARTQGKIGSRQWRGAFAKNLAFVALGGGAGMALRRLYQGVGAATYRSYSVRRVIVRSGRRPVVQYKRTPRWRYRPSYYFHSAQVSGATYMFQRSIKW
ncbi:hypothetical protein [Barrientosiimonas endolithica]|uniref:RHS repeat-associated protein n=1 Tax=Barrientosiimonas endolithica TaxID=1535208 RepID=A0ABM8HFB8_9MICO|nr:hypothetical protein [Barrientosiimonas endolithica]BDZ59639.1 hypothetical protein GCM10025872_32960 [Barrientosiimonas endolithica]